MPYAFTITTSMITAIGLSVIVWIAGTTLGLQRHGIRLFAFFVPSGTPLPLVPLLSFFFKGEKIKARAKAKIKASQSKPKELISQFKSSTPKKKVKE